MVWDGYYVKQFEKFKINDEVIYTEEMFDSARFLKIGETYTVKDIYGSIVQLKELIGCEFSTACFVLKKDYVVKYRLEKIKRLQKPKWYRRLFKWG